MSDYEYGIYILQDYAGIAGVSPPAVLAAYKARYGGNDAVAAIGKMARGLSVGAMKQKFQDIADENPGSVDVSRADLNQVLFDLGGTLPATTTLAVQAVEQTGSQIVSTAETAGAIALGAGGLLTVAAIVLGLVYLSVESKGLL